MKILGRNRRQFTLHFKRKHGELRQIWRKYFARVARLRAIFSSKAPLFYVQPVIYCYVLHEIKP